MTKKAFSPPPPPPPQGVLPFVRLNGYVPLCSVWFMGCVDWESVSKLEHFGEE